MTTKKINNVGDVAISVVIGTFNGERSLSAALDALEAQVTEFTYEVLVVNEEAFLTHAVQNLSIDLHRRC